MSNELEIISQNIMKIDAELLTAYKEYINHLSNVKEFYVRLQNKYEQEESIRNVMNENEEVSGKKEKK